MVVEEGGGSGSGWSTGDGRMGAEAAGRMGLRVRTAIRGRLEQRNGGGLMGRRG